ncbi:protein CutA homolog isoform X2 [Nothobranchius furzeri]|uniref:protein CutA homolog isoform X2 n=1 Tax=Nothobranchius furzeri TaxID=105023 RepID=UPI0039049DDD
MSDICAANRMKLLLQRLCKEAAFGSALRSMILITSLFLVLTVSVYPGLRSLAIQLHAAITGSYVPGHYSVLLINSPNVQTAKDVGRAVMEKHLAASVNIFSKTSTMTIHPYANPEVLGFSVEDGSSAYMKWMDEAIPDD